MTDDERREEGAEEAIEDLEAPAESLEDVAGGRGKCMAPSCLGSGSKVVVNCEGGTCKATMADCDKYSKVIIFHEA
jgi:hypothetical protein